MSLTGISYLVTVTQQKAAAANSEAATMAERQRALYQQKAGAQASAQAPAQTGVAQQLALKLRMFETTLTPAEALLLDEWLRWAQVGSRLPTYLR